MTGSRRGRGEGAVYYEAARRRWVGVLDLGRDGNGRRVRRKVVGPTEKAARDALRRLREEVENGARARNGNLTVEAFLLDWLEREVPKLARSVNTRDNYAWAIKCHLVPGLGSHRLAKLTPDHVDDLLESRAARGMAKNSLRRIRAVLVTALDHADRRELVRRNVARLTSTPEGQFTERRSLTAAEAGALLGSMRGDRLEGLVIVGVTMGLRPGELTGLSWRDVDLDAGVVHIRRALKRENNRPVMGELKTKRSRRSLACPPFVVDALRGARTSRRLSGRPLALAGRRAGRPSSWCSRRRRGHRSMRRTSGGTSAGRARRRASGGGCRTRCATRPLRCCPTTACRWSTWPTSSGTTEPGWSPRSTAMRWRRRSTWQQTGWNGCWGAAGAPTANLRLPSWLPRPPRRVANTRMTRADALVIGVGRKGLEPLTPCASCRCSSQLS
jgi:integrase